MEYVAVIGLLFAPVICLLCAGWFFVRWKNEHENQKLALRDRENLLRLAHRRRRIPGDLRRAEAPVSYHRLTWMTFCTCQEE